MIVGQNIWNELNAEFPEGYPPLRVEANGELVLHESCTEDQVERVNTVLAAHDPQKIDARKAIATIEREQPVTQRALREMILVIGSAFPAAQQTLFYQRASEQEAEIVALRAQI